MEKWLILDQNHGLTPLWKTLHFSTFSTSCFYSIEGRIFALQQRKTHFPGLDWLTKKEGKMANFRPKPWANPFGKISIFWTFSTSCFYSLERRFFDLEYHITHFPGLDCLKKNDGKMANFGPKPWTNPFGKISIF